MGKESVDFGQRELVIFKEKIERLVVDDQSLFPSSLLRSLLYIKCLASPIRCSGLD